MKDLIDLDRFPLDRLDAPEGRALIADCKAALARDGMFNLDRLLRPAAVVRTVAELAPILETASFAHVRRHNIYFNPAIQGLPPDHPALRQVETSNRTICADQFPESPVIALYEWPPLARFLAAVMQKPALYTMDDPLARVNVMAYGAGQALNWHFDRSEFTTTMLLQAPDAGGAFEFRTDLRSADDPNYPGVARLLEGEDPEVRQIALSPGTLNVFKGKNTAHRVTPVEGASNRVIAVFSFYDRPGVTFSAEERRGFYGRAA